MSSEIWVGLISGLLGVAAAAIPTYIAQRRHPSRITTEAVTLVDAGGVVVRTLKEEIARQEAVNDRLEAEVQAAQAKADHADAQAQRCQNRIFRLEQAMRAAGLDPALV